VGRHFPHTGENSTFHPIGLLDGTKNGFNLLESEGEKYEGKNYFLG
jgi:hypothetical protein